MNEMPKDWWPDMVIVRGTVDRDEKRLELCFAMMAPDLDQPELMQMKLEGLRLALWQELQK